MDFHCVVVFTDDPLMNDDRMSVLGFCLFVICFCVSSLDHGRG